MKTKFLFLLLLIMTQLTFGTSLQDTEPTTINSIISLITNSFVDFSAFVLGCVMFIDMLKNAWPDVFKDTLLKVVSYGSPVVFAVAAFYLKLGFFAESANITATLITGVLASAGAFGWASMDLLKKLLEFLGADPSGRRERIRKAA